MEALDELLAEDVVLYADGGGKAIAPAVPLPGAALVAQFVVSVARMRRELGEFEPQLVTVNGQPGRLRRVRVPGGDRVWEVLTVEVADGRIQTVRLVRNPDKLAYL